MFVKLMVALAEIKGKSNRSVRNVLSYFKPPEQF